MNWVSKKCLIYWQQGLRALFPLISVVGCNCSNILAVKGRRGSLFFIRWSCCVYHSGGSRSHPPSPDLDFDLELLFCLFCLVRGIDVGQLQRIDGIQQVEGLRI